MASAAIALAEVSQYGQYQSPPVTRWLMAGCVGFVVGLWLGLGGTLMFRVLRRDVERPRHASIGPRLLTGGPRAGGGRSHSGSGANRGQNHALSPLTVASPYPWSDRVTRQRFPIYPAVKIPIA